MQKVLLSQQGVKKLDGHGQERIEEKEGKNRERSQTESSEENIF